MANSPNFRLPLPATLQFVNELGRRKNKLPILGQGFWSQIGRFLRRIMDYLTKKRDNMRAKDRHKMVSYFFAVPKPYYLKYFQKILWEDCPVGFGYHTVLRSSEQRCYHLLKYSAKVEATMFWNKRKNTRPVKTGIFTGILRKNTRFRGL